MPHRNLYAAVDLGSNSFHMLVARREHDELRVIDRIREMVRIAGGLDARGNLDAATRDRALACLSRFGQRIAGIPVHQVRAVGTQTFRRMRHPESFLIVAETALGSAIDIISGREEARLVWQGVSQGTALKDHARLVIDIGGGSTEFAAGRADEPESVESIQFGCVGVTRKAFGKGRITTRRWQRAADEISTELLALRPMLDRTGWQRAIGSSGTMRSVLQVLQTRAGNAEERITRAGVEWMAERILKAGHVEKVDLPGVSARRQPVIAGGVVVLQACMRTLDIEQIEVSPFALREGLLYNLVGRLEHRDPRDKTVDAMAERFGADHSQAGRVGDFALCAFEQISEQFQLRRIHRDLLDWSCRLHELGLAISHSHYQLHSAWLVEHADMAGFTRQEQQFMAFLLRYQRRRIGSAALEELPARLRAGARPLLVILRLAVALARSRNDADLPDFSLQVIDQGHLRLAVPPGWPGAHPLSARALELERGYLKSLGMKLTLGQLARPHPSGPA
ncbi:MAG: exopolyphosphatase [Wenzhouxiangellaceae bacterium]